MTEKFKKRLIHFKTHGNIIEDFVCARTRRTRTLRRIIHACFYTQCAAAVCCIIAALALDIGAALAAVIAGAVASCVVAFIALGGGAAEKTILYLLDIVYAVISFTAGAMGAGAAFFICGALMLLAAAVSFVGYYVSHLRDFLTGFSPARITKDDYTLIPLAGEIMNVVKEEPLTPPPPPKTELMMLSEQLAEILSQEPKKLVKKDKPAAIGHRAASDTETHKIETTDDAPPPLNSKSTAHINKFAPDTAEIGVSQAGSFTAEDEADDLKTLSAEKYNVQSDNINTDIINEKTETAVDLSQPFITSILNINVQSTSTDANVPATDVKAAEMFDSSDAFQTTDNAPPPFMTDSLNINTQRARIETNVLTTDVKAAETFDNSAAQTTDNAPPPFMTDSLNINTQRARIETNVLTTDVKAAETLDNSATQTTDNAPPPFMTDSLNINTQRARIETNVLTTDVKAADTLDNSVAQTTDNAPPPFMTDSLDINAQRTRIDTNVLTTDVKAAETFDNSAAQTTDNAPPPFMTGAPNINAQNANIPDNSLTTDGRSDGSYPNNINTVQTTDNAPPVRITPKITEDNK